MRPWPPDPHDSVKYLQQNKDYVCQKKKLIQIKSSQNFTFTYLKIYFVDSVFPAPLSPENKQQNGLNHSHQMREPKPATNNSLIINNRAVIPLNITISRDVIAALGGALSFL